MQTYFVRLIWRSLPLSGRWFVQLHAVFVCGFPGLVVSTLMQAYFVRLIWRSLPVNGCWFVLLRVGFCVLLSRPL